MLAESYLWTPIRNRKRIATRTICNLSPRLMAAIPARSRRCTSLSDWACILAYRFTGDNDLALDVLQETFLYFLKKFPGFVLTAALNDFLYPVVKNLSIGRVARPSGINRPKLNLRPSKITPAAAEPPRRFRRAPVAGWTTRGAAAGFVDGSA